MPDFNAEPFRTVTVELLRKGRPHNQLLSPLTDYLGICGESGACTVSVPYEQAELNVMLDNLRYVDSEEQDHSPRQRALRTLGRDIGEMLGAVPGFTGSLTTHESSDAILNLRIVTSASELSLLPFELAKMPSVTGRSTNEWLALQAATPVCITRRSRAVPTHCARWGTESRPRVLFIVGLDIPKDLAQEHRDALLEALTPWQEYDPEQKAFSNESLVELGLFDDCPLPTAEAIREHLKSGFSHVHILAHGAECEQAEGVTYGLFLPSTDPVSGQPTTEFSDVVTGDRFASMLASIDREIWPSVVVTASCDSGNQGDLLFPGGSFGHSLHEAGVPLVIASQFPLTMEGSVRLTRSLYSDLFWGGAPLQTLARTRATLHASDAHAHDWASIVVYDGLPDTLAEQVLQCRYRRAKEALSNSQKLLRLVEPPDGCDPATLAEQAMDSMPSDGGYEREREGLIASHSKQRAEAEHQKGKRLKKGKQQREHYVTARAYLERARRRYYRAARGFLHPDNARQLEATLHWVLTQAIAMDRLFGSSSNDMGWTAEHRETFGQGSEEMAWGLSFQSIKAALESNPDSVWDHGTMTELWLIKLFEDIDEDAAQAARRNALDHATRMAQLSDAARPFPVFSVKRQMKRYAETYTRAFRADLQLGKLDADQESRWDEVRELAAEIAELLERFDPSGGG